jgi:PiT family inorganic phosphate transporter
VIAGVVCFVGLFFLQNVFNQKVYEEVPYVLSEAALERLEEDGVATGALAALERLEEDGVATGALRELENLRYASAAKFRRALEARSDLSQEQRSRVMRYAEQADLLVDPARFARLDPNWLTAAQIAALRSLAGRRFQHKWQLAEALAEQSEAWRSLPDPPANKAHNKDLERKLDSLYRAFRSSR